jgi:hypothetical protein
MGAIAGRLWARTFAVAALSLVGSASNFATPAWTQVQRSGEPPEVPQPTGLTGDWGGLRSYLEGKGVTLTFNYTNDFCCGCGQRGAGWSLTNKQSIHGAIPKIV